MPAKHLFVSYARHDLPVVRLVVDALQLALRARKAPVDLWFDVGMLNAGESWHDTIQRALGDSVGVLFFLSPAALASEFVAREIAAAQAQPGRLILPILIERGTVMPPALQALNAFDLSDAVDDRRMLDARVDLLAEQIAARLPAAVQGPGLPARLASQLADLATTAVRRWSAPGEPVADAATAASVFVVHGHDLAARDLVCSALTGFGIEPVVLSKQVSGSRSLLEKFLTVAEQARFAVVIVSADDVGAALRQYDAPGVGERALRFRMRQNVVLELGFFYGRLGWENVFVLQAPPPKVFPDFERPSDLDGVMFDEIDAAGRWREVLVGKLRAARFTIAPASPPSS